MYRVRHIAKILPNRHHLRAVIYLAGIIMLFLQSSVAALSNSDIQSILGGTPYYDPSSTISCLAVSSETGTGPLFGPVFPDVADPQDLVNRINKFIADTQPTSPFTNLGSDFVAAGQKYNVNPAMMVGIANKEESLGTRNDQPVNKDNHNSFGATGVPGFQTVNGFASFPSFQASIDPVTHYVASTYLDPSGSRYSTTVLEVMKNGYTPGSNFGQATAMTVDVMHKILDGIAETAPGGNTTSSAQTSFVPGSVSDARCQSTNGYQAGANGYDLTGANAMAHFYQCDSQWGSQPYGAGKTSICDSGCGITSLAMVVDTLAGANETPLTLANKYGNQYHVTIGTDWSLWPVAAKDYRLSEQDIGTNLTTAASIIRQGGLVIISVNAGYFTSDSHLMVIRAVDNQGNFYLADPNAPGNKAKGHDTENQGFSADFLNGSGNLYRLFAFTKVSQ